MRPTRRAEQVLVAGLHTRFDFLNVGPWIAQHANSKKESGQNRKPENKVGASKIPSSFRTSPFLLDFEQWELLKDLMPAWFCHPEANALFNLMVMVQTWRLQDNWSELSHRLNVLGLNFQVFPRLVIRWIFWGPKSNIHLEIMKSKLWHVYKFMHAPMQLRFMSLSHINAFNISHRRLELPWHCWYFSSRPAFRPAGFSKRRPIALYQDLRSFKGTSF